MEQKTVVEKVFDGLDRQVLSIQSRGYNTVAKSLDFIEEMDIILDLWYGADTEVKRWSVMDRFNPAVLPVFEEELPHELNRFHRQFPGVDTTSIEEFVNKGFDETLLTKHRVVALREGLRKLYRLWDLARAKEAEEARKLAQTQKRRENRRLSF